MRQGFGARPPPSWMADARPPPPGYICYRCGKQGHHIQACPTIGDPSFDNRPKLKKTTGIPKMFLKAVEQEDAPAGTMVTMDGDFVVARPNEEAWAKLSVPKRAREVQEVKTPMEFQCESCHSLLRDAVTTPCCRTNYCDDCNNFFTKVSEIFLLMSRGAPSAELA